MNVIYGVERFPLRNENYKTIEGDVLDHCDICVIGGGAAGSVMAKKLCDAGRSVVLVERGGYYEGEDMNQQDECMLPLLWKNSGANFTSDMRIAIAQGSCLGGSTIINDAVCFPIPDVVKRQWRTKGVKMSDEDWDQAPREVSNDIHITKVRDDELSRNSLMLKKGCELMGYEKHYPNSRNSVNCMQCGLCHLGCHYGTKQDMRETYIHKALNNTKSSITIYCNCSVEKITCASGSADGVEGYFLDALGKPVAKIRVNARLVIVACGSIGSSHLLQKSSIANDKIGKGLSLHPAPFVLGDFPFEIRGIQGIPMTYTLHDFGVTNGVEDGGFLIEGIFLPPLQFSLLIPISGGLHEELMGRYNYFAMAGVLVRDESNGSIELTDLGFPRINYTLSSKDLDLIARGSEIIARMWFKLGAKRIVTSHIKKQIINREDEIPEMVIAIKNDPKNLLLGSAHPQGGNRMGDDPQNCVVDSDCKVYGFENLFVCDASVFPTSVGVNPQLTVMSLATIIADRINLKWPLFAAIDVKDALGETCSVKQPMFCSTKSLDAMYEIRDSALNAKALINSPKKEIVDEDNWSFNKDTLTIWNNRYWKGFFTSDHDAVNTTLIYAGGFWKRFWENGNAVNGETHPFESVVFAPSEAVDAEYPGFGRVVLLKYVPPYDRFYDLLKIVDPDTILGKAFAVRDPPRGEHILTFSLSKRYSVDFMTQDDFKAIFSIKTKRPDPDEVLGRWEGRLISDSTLSPTLFRFKFYKENSELKCKYIFGGVLPGTSDVKFTEDMMLMFDFTGQLLHDELRMVRKDFMVGKYCAPNSPIIKLMERASGFVMKDDSRLCLPYILRRIG
ncbi:MAG: GMC family oxidoreductase [Methanothrix sp.]|nr:GMC family oxidoreductase [Methanothrix sp.]